VEEAEATARIAKGKLLPTIAAFGGYLDQYGFDPWHQEANWFSGLGASVPLFDGSLHADLARDRILRERAQAHLVSVENQIRLDIRTAWPRSPRAAAGWRVPTRRCNRPMSHSGSNKKNTTAEPGQWLICC
jgi:outer membrane protein TolC